MMKRLMLFPAMALWILVVAGCATPAPVKPPPAGPDFCLVEEPRRFSQAELDWRASNGVTNLRRDFKTNTTWEDAGCDAIRAELIGAEARAVMQR